VSNSKETHNGGHGGWGFLPGVVCDSQQDPSASCSATAFGTRKGQKRCGKDAIFYIQVFGHRPPRKAPHRRLNACGRGRRWGKATGRVTRTAPKPANSLLSRRQEQKEWEGGSKEPNAMRRGGKREVQWAIAILNSMADGQALTP